MQSSAVQDGGGFLRLFDTQSSAAELRGHDGKLNITTSEVSTNIDLYPNISGFNLPYIVCNAGLQRVVIQRRLTVEGDASTFNLIVDQDAHLPSSNTLLMVRNESTQDKLAVFRLRTPNNLNGNDFAQFHTGGGRGLIVSTGNTADTITMSSLNTVSLTITPSSVNVLTQFNNSSDAK